MKKKRGTILITGGAGFIGCNAADYFLKKGYRAVVLDDLSRKGAEENLRWLRNTWHSRLTFVKADVAKDIDTLRGLAKRADAVIHLAAQVAVTTSVDNPRHDFNVNVLGTLNVLEAVRQAPKPPPLIFASTNKVYGGMGDVRIARASSGYRYVGLPAGVAEHRRIDFHSPYGCSKGAADQYVRDYARVYGLKTVVFRQSCIYGPHQFGIEDQGWVAWFVISALLGKPLTIYGDGHQVRDVLYIEDLCHLYERAIASIDAVTGEIYNIGGGSKQAFSLLGTIRLLEEIMRKPVVYSFADWRPGDQKVYVSDIRKIKRALGWEPRADFANGLRKLARWANANQSVLLRHVLPK